MAGENIQRRLAAIMVADVVGYSRLMERDETGTLAALRNQRETILQPVVAKHQGRIVKLMGDGVLVDFASAVNAVACAVDLQSALTKANMNMPVDRQIELRIGINLGDILIEGSDLYGDGVNIAARLEGLAEPGGIIVSETVVSHVRGKVTFGFEDLGEKKLKNIDGQVRIFKVSGSRAAATRNTLKDSSRIAIAVLPFVNMSGDPEQEYFSDGITEDIITDLSKISALNVVSRNSAFTFKGRPTEVAQVAQRLNVGHIVEGSVRKAGGRVRITAQLIDANKDSHIWAERYDREMTDIFALQDEITQAIVAALKVKLLPKEKEAVANRSTHDLGAYQLYLQGRHHLGQHGLKNLEIAIRFAQQALEIDSQYALAWALIAHCQSALHLRGRMEDTGLSAAEKALSLDPKLAEAHGTRGRILLDLGRHDEAIAEHEESIRLNPKSAEVRHLYGRTCYQLGLGERAIEQFERAAELDQSGYGSLSFVAQIYEGLGQADRAREASRRAFGRIEEETARHPDNAMALSFGAGLLIQLGERARAKDWISRASIIAPDDPVIQFNVACSLAQLGEQERAIDLLEAVARNMTSAIVSWLKNDTELAPLCDHPRYKALIAREEARFGIDRG